MLILFKKYKIETIFLLAVFLVFVILSFRSQKLGAGLLAVEFFSVGQGDSAFIESPSGRQILVDAGPGGAVLNKLGESMDFYDRYIDIVVATHFDSDHVGGLIDVLKRYKIGTLILSDTIKSDNSLYLNELSRVISRQQIKTLVLLKDSKILIEPGLGIYFFNPDFVKRGNDNDDSIVARLVFGKTSFLFTADISQSEERRLLSENLRLDSDVLKVAHHGSKNSNSDEFLSAVSPLISIISSGAGNKYGHPHQEVLNKLKNSKIFRTDLDGNVKILSDGFKIWKD